MTISLYGTHAKKYFQFYLTVFVPSIMICIYYFSYRNSLKSLFSLCKNIKINLIALSSCKFRFYVRLFCVVRSAVCLRITRFSMNFLFSIHFFFASISHSQHTTMKLAHTQRESKTLIQLNENALRQRRINRKNVFALPKCFPLFLNQVDLSQG